MELLPQGQRNNTQVTFEDQQKINEFSKLIMRKDTVAQELTLQKQEKEYLDDVSLEIELIDEDEPVQYKVGDLFIFMKQSKVAAHLEEDAQLLEDKIQTLQDKQGEIDGRLDALKASLYAKFGDNINLER
ncbi:tubulin-binding prefolding complex subunit GIM3 [Saccharomyces eubayanus]|uniref:tubulin-binding prefolding complex subunit GIM3 n=1 Tax=Saccharomyces eubayanus TaxID=1080349 RepID=UPI0006C51CEA|nr:GIM3-like protein [Saccharomyces eubayanus]KOG97012.1 GIM3-like protein [Saccharomyces eubayanus]